MNIANTFLIPSCGSALLHHCNNNKVFVSDSRTTTSGWESENTQL